MKIVLQPELLRWARLRAGFNEDELAKKVQVKPEKISRWEEDGGLTFKQAEKLAEKTYTPFGYLFLDEPPEEKLPIGDFRTIPGEEKGKPSPELLDTLYDAMEKQSWYRDYLIELEEPRLDYVGSISVNPDTAEAANKIRDHLQIGAALRTEATDWQQAFRFMIERLEEKNLLVLRSGVAKGNPHRPLNVEEFRGFALSDTYAPLIFVNSTDSPAARMFTLIHELVHVCLGISGVSDIITAYSPGRRLERFCNEVAGLILIPSDDLKSQISSNDSLNETVAKLRQRYKVSSVVVLWRLFDEEIIDREIFLNAYRAEEESYKEYSRARKKKVGGGDYYATKGARLSVPFAQAVIGSAREGRTPYSEAFSLLGIKKPDTFSKFAEKVGMGA